MNRFPGELHFISLPRCDSTNNYIKRNFKSLQERLPVLVTSGLQTAGRGREQRTWVSPPGQGLYSSFGFKLDSVRNLNFLPLAVGISVIEALNSAAGVRLGLKWPNDILHENKKIAGILIENVITEEEIFSIAGIGINLNQDTADFPEELRERAVSLKMISGVAFSPEAINPVLARVLFGWLEKLKGDGGNEIIDTANGFSRFLMNKPISFHQPSGNKRIAGIFKGINHDGGLILEDESGNNTIYYSGEIIQLHL